MKIKSGWIDKANKTPSDNFDSRPTNCLPTLVVIHCISLPPGEFGGDAISQLFTNCLPADGHPYFAEIHQFKVSSHLLIRRDGEVIQYVPFQARAWHAGQSVYQQQESCNDFSIGIELEGTEEIAYTAEQYQQLAAVIRLLLETYPSLSSSRIVGHSDIAPGRKTDPGPSFKWDSLHTLLTSSEVKS